MEITVTFTEKLKVALRIVEDSKEGLAKRLKENG